MVDIPVITGSITDHITDRSDNMTREFSGCDQKLMETTIIDETVMLSKREKYWFLY
jgi:hypothetical protein